MSDHTDEGKEAYTANARIAGRPEPVELNPVGPCPSSATQEQEPLKPRTLRQPEQPKQANIRQPEGSRWAELPDRVDALSTEMRAVLCALRELQQEKHEKAALQRDLEEVQDKLQKNTVVLEDFQQDKRENIALRKELQETQGRLEKTNADLREVHKNWKKTVSQLNQLRSQGTGLYQLSDSYLIELVKQLRYDTQTFSLQYFTRKSPGQSENLPAGEFWKYMHDITPGSDDYRIYLMSETDGPVVIRSFLWRLLAGEIFERFCWAPLLKKSITHVYQVLQPFTYSDEWGREIPTAPETERRFQMWKATTSALILEFMKDNDQVDSQKLVEDFSLSFSERVLDVIKPFVQNLDEGILHDLRDIVEKSIALDQEICRQAARVDWIFPTSGNPVPFDPDYMAADVGEVTPEPGQHVRIAITPALTKRGRSMGDNFETEYLLLKMDVTCVPLSSGQRSSTRVTR